MRPDMIGPRRLQPAKIESHPISFLTTEDSNRVLKSQVMPGVTEGQTNGSMPRSPSTRPGLFIGGEISKAQEIKKKIPGQQGITEPLGPGDASAASSHHDWKASDAPHIEAAKHFIQADHFSRQPGGEGRAKMHQTALSKLKAQGASPKKEHYKQAMSELPPHFSKLMNSLDAQKDQGQ